MRQEIRNIYTFSELSDEAKEAACDYVRNNWHDLGQHYVDYMEASLKALAEAVGGKLDYAISIAPDRGEFISIKDFSEKLAERLYHEKDNCPLTGMCYDIDVIEGLYLGDLQYRALKVLHADGEYTYSDEGLSEMFEANDYEFLQTGRLYNGN